MDCTNFSLIELQLAISCKFFKAIQIFKVSFSFLIEAILKFYFFLRGYSDLVGF